MPACIPGICQRQVVQLGPALLARLSGSVVVHQPGMKKVATQEQPRLHMAMAQLTKGRNMYSRVMDGNETPDNHTRCKALADNVRVWFIAMLSCEVCVCHLWRLDKDLDSILIA